MVMNALKRITCCVKNLKQYWMNVISHMSWGKIEEHMHLWKIHDGATDKIQTYRLLAEAMSHFAVAQVKGKKLLHELKVYIGKD